MKIRLISTAMILMVATTLTFATGHKTKAKTGDSNVMYSITGTVVDKATGEALAGVLIKVNETGTTVYTDFEGNFELSVAPGKYKLSTSFISYETTAIELDANGSKDQVDLSLNSLSARK
jgi:hypothetical protein